MQIFTRLFLPRAPLYKLFIFIIADPRVAHLPFLKSPLPIFALVFLYVAFVQKWGPKLMENRKPFELKTAINIFNFVQILTNLFIAVAVSRIMKYTYAAKSTKKKFFLPISQLLCSSYFRKDFSFRCQTNDESGSYQSEILIFATYVYYLSKIADLLDTVGCKQNIQFRSD
jgi:hypothetical protein